MGKEQLTGYISGRRVVAEAWFQVASIGHADQPSVSAWFNGWLDTLALGNAIAAVTSCREGAGCGGEGRRAGRHFCAACGAMVCLSRPRGGRLVPLLTREDDDRACLDAGPCSLRNALPDIFRQQTLPLICRGTVRSAEFTMLVEGRPFPCLPVCKQLSLGANMQCLLSKKMPENHGAG